MAASSVISSDVAVILDESKSIIDHVDQQRRQEQLQPHWCGCFHAVVRAPLPRVWDVTRRFASVDTWAPSVVSWCRLVEGEAEDRVGCVRVCDGADGRFLGRERLLAMDDAAHHYSYVVEDSIIPGLTGYISTFQLHHLSHMINHVCQDDVPYASNIKNSLHRPPPRLHSNRNDTGSNDHHDTHITWSYRVPPVASTSPHDFQRMIFGYYARCIDDLETYLRPN